MLPKLIVTFLVVFSQLIVPPSASTIALMGTTVLDHSGMITGFVPLPDLFLEKHR